MIKQCTTLIAKQDFNFRSGATNRVTKVRAGDKFWVTSVTINKGSICFARNSQPLHYDNSMPEIELRKYFHIAE